MMVSLSSEVNAELSRAASDEVQLCDADKPDSEAWPTSRARLELPPLSAYAPSLPSAIDSLRGGAAMKSGYAPPPPPPPPPSQPIPEGLGDEAPDTDNEMPTVYPAEERFDQTIDQTRAALLEAHGKPNLPHIYNFAGNCAILEDNGNGGRIIRSIRSSQGDVAMMQDILSRVVNFSSRRQNGEERPVQPPRNVALCLTANPGNLPQLAGVVDVPSLRLDGTLIDRPGYDPASRLFYAPAKEVSGLKVPAVPSPEEVRLALAAIRTPFTRFPFKSEADRANYLGLLLTAIARPLIAGNVPMFVVASPIQGAGKSKLTYCASMIATGGKDNPMSPAERAGDEEMRKRLAAILASRPRMVIIDNFVGRLDSPSLASVLTTGVWSDRVLCRSEIIAMEVQAVFICTGVNIEVAGDMSRRCYWIRLDPGVGTPWKREFEFDPEIYVRERRVELVAALLTLIRHWLARGKPDWGKKAPGSFESWARTIGGILKAAGIEGFLDNRDLADDAANQELDALLTFYEAWVDKFRGAGQRPSDVVTAAKGFSPECRAFKEALLEEMLAVIDLTDGRAAKRMGAILNKYKDRVAGDLKLTCIQVSHTKGRLWTVAPANAVA